MNVQLLITVLAIIIFGGAVYWLIGKAPESLPAPFKQFAQYAVLVVVVLWVGLLVLRALGVA